MREREFRCVLETLLVYVVKEDFRFDFAVFMLPSEDLKMFDRESSIL